MNRFFSVIFIMAIALLQSVCADDIPPGDAEKKDEALWIKVIVGEETFTAVLEDNPTASDFLSLLPLTLTLRDYSGTEKISNLPKRLTTEKAPPGIDPSVGDLAYYAPWGNLALFYNDFGFSSGLVLLGKLEAGIDAFKGSSSMTVTFEPMDRVLTP